MDFNHSTLFDSIETLSGKKIVFGERKFMAKGLDEEKSKLLSLPVGAPILYLDQITYLNGMIPVESSKCMA